MYGIGGEQVLRERVLEHLEGYAASRRCASATPPTASGRSTSTARRSISRCSYQRLGGSLGEQHRRLLETFALHVAAHWQEPDQGLWEMRSPPRQHLHGKLMSWVALDRARQLFDDGRDWAAQAERVRAEIALRGIDRTRGHLAQAFDGGLDAAVLLAPMLGFPLERQTLAQTVDTLEHGLGRGDFLARYDGADGQAGERGRVPDRAASGWSTPGSRSAGSRRRGHCRAPGALRQRRRPLCRGDRPARRRLSRQFPAGVQPSRADRQRGQPAALRAPRQRRRGRQLCRSRAARGRATLRLARPLAALRQSQRVGRLRSSEASKLAWP